jgi:Amt family ammonium transporter
MLTIKRKVLMLGASVLSLIPAFAVAQDEISGANTAWILTATALVLFMTVPGLSLFYAGLVRSKNVLSILMQCFSIAAVVSILWLSTATVSRLVQPMVVGGVG